MAQRKRAQRRSTPPAPKKILFWPYGTLLFIALLVADQYTKWAIRSSYLPGESHTVFSWLSFTYVQNTGILWSMLPGMNTLLVWLSIIIFGLLIFWYDRFVTTVEKISYTLILVGLWGNLLDRVSYGFVVDFVDLGWWPVFNIADSCIVVAVALLLLEQLRNKNS